MKDLLLAIVNIFKCTGKIFTTIRNFIFNTILLCLIVAIAISLVPQASQDSSDNSILRLDISGDIVEQKKLFGSFEKYFGQSMGLKDKEPETSLQDILDVINSAAKDDTISSILLNLSEMKSGGLNQLISIGRALENFRDQDKVVIASENFYSQSQYFLASYADKIILNPMGAVDIHGFGVYRLYFKEAIERLKINYNIFKVGSYKSALEPFTRDSMSNEDKRQNELWLSSLWQLYIDQIVKQRDISPDSFNQYTNNISISLKNTNGNTAELAKHLGFVDEIWTRQETARYLKTLDPGSARDGNFVSSEKYLLSLTPSYSNDKSKSSRIGLIVAEGNILPGNQPAGFIGGKSLSKLIKKAKDDKSVKAIVLRINSGGGSAFASEIIRQELLECKKAGKPFIVSMGAVAASGGYWIAADADQIWASEATITGSIGIFGAIPTFEKSLAELGIYSDGTGTTSLAAGLNVTQPLPPQLKSAIQQNVVHNYQNFIEIVAKGRQMERSRVEKLAQGRVYDGRSAQQLGLVDNLGSLTEAIQGAAKLADIKDYSVTYIKATPSVQSKFIQFLSTQLLSFFKTEYHPSDIRVKIETNLTKLFKELQLLQDPRGVYALCPLELSF